MNSLRPRRNFYRLDRQGGAFFSFLARSVAAVVGKHIPVRGAQNCSQPCEELSSQRYGSHPRQAVAFQGLQLGGRRNLHARTNAHAHAHSSLSSSAAISAYISTSTKRASEAAAFHLSHFSSFFPSVMHFSLLLLRPVCARNFPPPHARTHARTRTRSDEEK